MEGTATILTKLLELLVVPLSAVLGFLYRKTQRLEERLTNSYSKKEAQEMMEVKIDPVYKTLEKIEECVDRLNGTVEKLNTNLDEIRIKQAQQEGEKEARRQEKLAEKKTPTNSRG